MAVEAALKGKEPPKQEQKEESKHPEVTYCERDAEEAVPRKPAVITDPTTGMEFVHVLGGCFQMGDTFGDGEEWELPVHEVCVDGFYMGVALDLFDRAFFIHFTTCTTMKKIKTYTK